VAGRAVHRGRPVNILFLSKRTTDLLKACLRSGDDAEQAYAEWRQYANFSDLTAREFRLMPYLLENLQRRRIQDSRTAWIAGQAKYTWVANILRLPEMHAGIRTLNSRGLRFCLMKGAALRARWPQLTARRQMGDWDVLVPKDQARWCLYELQKTGWKSALPEFLTDTDLGRFHALGMGGKHHSEIDIHWRPLEAVDDDRYTAEVFQRREPGNLEGEPVWLAGLTDHLFILLAHAFHDVVVDRADWVVEATMLFRLSEPDVWDWHLFRRLARRYRLESWVEQSLMFAAGISGDPVPPAVFSWRSLSGWLRPLQNREIVMRGRQARTILNQAARLNGMLGRGSSPIDLPVHPEPPRSTFEFTLRRARVKSALTPIRPEGVDLSAVPMGVSLLAGWSIPEVAGRWTFAPRAIIALAADDFEEGETIPICLDFHTDGTPDLCFSCWGGADTSSWSAVAGDPLSDELIVNGRATTFAGRRVLPIVLTFEGLRNLETRRKLVSEPRTLGLFLRRMTFAPRRYLPSLERPIETNTIRSNAMTFGGWSYPEAEGRWSTGNVSCLQFRMPFGRLRRIGLDILQYFCADRQPRRLEFQANGIPCGAIELPHTPVAGDPVVSGLPVEIVLPSELRPRDYVKLEIKTKSDASPKTIGLSDDPRRLGIYLRRVAPLV
jgi:hypothetical protein